MISRLRHVGVWYCNTILDLVDVEMLRHVSVSEAFPLYRAPGNIDVSEVGWLAAMKHLE